MKFTVDFNFEKEMIYIIFQSILGYLIYNYDNCVPIFIKEILLLISMIISIICFFKRKKYSYNENNDFYRERYFQINEKKEKKIKKGNIEIKEYLYIIIFFFFLNVIPFINGIQLNRVLIIFSVYANFLFIGIILIGYFYSTKLYNHQLLSAIVLFIIIFFHPNLSYNYNKYKKHNFIFSTIYSIIFYYIQGLFKGYFKFAMEIKFIDPFFISSVDVGMNMIKNILVIVYYYKKNINRFFEKNWKQKINEIKITNLIFASIGNIGYPIFDALNCYYNSPYHQCVAEYLGKLIKISFHEKTDKIDMIIAVINSIFSCIAAEIIILRFCGLEKNTKIAIEERLNIEDKDIYLISSQNNSISDSN